jgi:hypothetical protein
MKVGAGKCTRSQTYLINRPTMSYLKYIIATNVHVNA